VAEGLEAPDPISDALEPAVRAHGVEREDAFPGHEDVTERRTSRPRCHLTYSGDAEAPAGAGQRPPKKTRRADLGGGRAPQRRWTRSSRSRATSRFHESPGHFRRALGSSLQLCKRLEARVSLPRPRGARPVPAHVLHPAALAALGIAPRRAVL